MIEDEFRCGELAISPGHFMSAGRSSGSGPVLRRRDDVYLFVYAKYISLDRHDFFVLLTRTGRLTFGFDIDYTRVG